MQYQNFFSRKLILQVNEQLKTSYRKIDTSLPIELQCVVSPYKKTPQELRDAFKEAARRVRQA